MDCQAHGEAPIDIRWLKSGVKVVENERVYLLANGSLYISEVESRRGDKSDEGFYQCLAQNQYGAILSQKAHLTIASEYHARITIEKFVKNFFSPFVPRTTFKIALVVVETGTKYLNLEPKEDTV